MKNENQHEFLDANFQKYLFQTHSLQLGKAIGYGMSSVVFSCTSSSSQLLQSKFAIKLCNLSPLLFNSPRLKLRHEIECQVLQIFNQTHYRNIVQVIKSGVYEGRIGYIVMEYLQGGHLSHLSARLNGLRIRVNKLQDKQVQSKYNTLIRQIIRSVMNQVLSILQILQYSGIIHRDIKLQNILISRQAYIKLIDFGTVYTHDQNHNTDNPDKLSRWVKIDQISKQLNTNDYMNGSRHYICPQLISGKKKRVTSTKIDVWGLGVMFFKLLTGAYPFIQLQSDNNSAYYTKIRSSEPEYSHYIDKQQLEVLQLCFQKDPCLRPSASQLRNKLAYFSNQGQSSLLQLIHQLSTIQKHGEFYVLWKADTAVKYCENVLEFQDQSDFKCLTQSQKVQNNKLEQNQQLKKVNQQRKIWKQAYLFLVRDSFNNSLVKIKIQSHMRKTIKLLHFTDIKLQRNTNNLIVKLIQTQKQNSHEIRFRSGVKLQQFIQQIMTVNTKVHTQL